LAGPAAKRSVQIVQAETHRASKGEAHQPEARKLTPVLAAAHASPSRAMQSTPVQTARADMRKTTQMFVRRAAQTVVGAPPVPPKATQAVAQPRPSLLARLPGLAALFAAPQSPARKPAPAVHDTAPVADHSIALSRSTKLADQTAKNPTPHPTLQVRSSSSPAAAPDLSHAALRTPARDDCSYARSRSEGMVCENGRLASLDHSVRRLYDAALGAADGEARDQLQRTRQRFLAYLNSCQSESCLARVYQVRMNEIRKIMAQE
jgi:hypothetical protein